MSQTLPKYTSVQMYQVSPRKLLPGPLIAEISEKDETPRMKNVSALMSLHVHETSRA
jgi:hypothetical protein